MTTLWLLALPMLATAQVATSISSTTTTSDTTVSQTPTPEASHPTFEIDVVFPRANTTYNYTDPLPIVFAVQNFSAVVIPGTYLTFKWFIQPYGRGGYPYSPGGVSEDSWTAAFDSKNTSLFTNSDGSPYIFVNNTNPHEWADHPYYQDGMYYALQWYIHWFPDNRDDKCVTSVTDSIVFTFLPETYETPPLPNASNLGNVTGNCAQPGSVVQVIPNGTDICPNANELPRESGKPCVVKPDAAMVSSISTAAASLAKAMTSSTSTTTSSSSSSVAVATNVPVRPALAAMMVLGGLQLVRC